MTAICLSVGSGRTDPLFACALKRVVDFFCARGAVVGNAFGGGEAYGFELNVPQPLAGCLDDLDALGGWQNEEAGFALVDISLAGETKTVVSRGLATADDLAAAGARIFSGPLFGVLADMAEAALFAELCRPLGFGSVTLGGSGSHDDMDLLTMLGGIETIAAGIRSLSARTAHDFESLRAAGKQLEARLFEASGGVNTYKGALFALLVVIGAIGREAPALLAVKKPADYARTLQRAIRDFAAPLAGDYAEKAATAGRRSFDTYGQAGARELAISGYERLLLDWWPRFRQKRNITLLMPRILSETWDTTTLKRGGFGMLMTLQRIARGSQAFDDQKHLSDWCVSHKLSTGGSADLIALLYFVDLFERFRHHIEI